MSIKDITVVITSFKSEKKIRNCLESIDSECKVINVENSNSYEHKKNVEETFKNVTCILTGENLGYGKANNIGLKAVKTKFALILNPDAELLPKTLNGFLSIAEKKPDFAILGPSICEKKNIKTNKLEPNIIETKTIKGFAMFLNLYKFKEIGFFDENFFIYLEEIDLCKRVIKNGNKIYFSPDIYICHEGGASHDNEINYEMELSRNWHWMWSTFYYNKKYKGFLISLILVLPKLISSILKMFIFAITKENKKKEIYYQRYSGLVNSIFGKSSWYRPKV